MQMESCIYPTGEAGYTGVAGCTDTKNKDHCCSRNYITALKMNALGEQGQHFQSHQGATERGRAEHSALPVWSPQARRQSGGTASPPRPHRE